MDPATVPNAAAIATTGDWNELILMWLTLIIFNVSIIQLLRVTLRGADFKEAMAEKAPSRDTGKTTTTTTTTVPPAPADGVQAQLGVAAPQAVVQETVQQTNPSETSYSRVAGMIGAVVLACFVWAVGNIILYKMIASPNEVASLLASLGTYFLAAASLFAPYAVNQLSSAFKPSAT